MTEMAAAVLNQFKAKLQLFQSVSLDNSNTLYLGADAKMDQVQMALANTESFRAIF